MRELAFVALSQTLPYHPMRTAEMTDADRHASLAAAHETRLKALLAGDLETLKTTVEGMTRSTTVYAFRNGGWQMVSQHQSRIE